MQELNKKITAIIFAAGRPVKLSELTKSLERPREEVKTALTELKEQFSQTGINLLEKDEKYQFVTAPDTADAVSRFLSAEVREKLTEAALETLAIIAYKQPISRAEIEAIRGVNSQYILRQLLIRGLIEKTVAPDDARRLVYKTTIDFMRHLGITDPKQLPDFEELTKSVQLPEQAPALSSSRDLEKGINNNQPKEQHQELEQQPPEDSQNKPIQV